MTSRHQRALRVLCIAFCSIGWTIFSASAKSIPSSDGEVDPCTPTALSARQAEGELGKSTLQYEVATVGSCNRPKCGERYFIIIQECQHGTAPARLIPRRNGSYCVRETGCYKAVCGNVTSNSVSLPGIEEIRVQVTRPTFWNSSLVEIAATSQDARVRGFEVEIRNTELGRSQRLAEIPDPIASINGSFVRGQCYTFLFKPKLKDTVECEGVVVGGIFACYNATDTAKPVDEGSSVSSNTALFLTFGLLFIAIVCVAVSVAIYRKKKTVIAQQGKPGEKTLKAKRVVVVHAFDDSKLQEKCKELCLAIGAHLGDSKNVQDIYLTKDPSLLQDPQSWVTEKVMDTGTRRGEEQGRTKFVLVLSPLMEHLQRALDEEKEEFDFFGRQPHPRDLVLKTLLRHLATPILKADYRRLFLVRFADLHDHRSGDLPNLVPGKRFVLPGHEGQLLEAIG
ncbi:uncharacterized protein [Penaeus vannamei]|uniref:uncharacterized protein isoform X2 n=1 Tax=Penaeus vannamei TaxID=6689 RepID=UPI00387FA804